MDGESDFGPTIYSRTLTCILLFQSLRRTGSQYQLYNLMIVEEQGTSLDALVLSRCEMTALLRVCQGREEESDLNEDGPGGGTKLAYPGVQNSSERQEPTKRVLEVLKHYREASELCSFTMRCH